MAVESTIAAKDGWFAGEDKVLRFTVETLDANIVGWTFSWSLHPRRSTETLMTKVNGAGITITGDKELQVLINAADTEALKADTYHHVLRRTDAGANQVLSFGPAVLRRAEVA